MSRSRVFVAAALATLVVAGGCSRAAAPSSSNVAFATDSTHLAVAGAANTGVSLTADGDRVVAVWAATTGEATNIVAAVSRDGGATFDAPVRVNDVDGDARVSGEQPPRVALAGGRVVVVWESNLGGASSVRLAASTDNGRTFSPATTVAPEGSSGARGWASLAVDAAGVAQVTWLDGRNAEPHHHHEGAMAMPMPMPMPMRQDVFHAVWTGTAVEAEHSVAPTACFCCKTATAVAPNGDVYIAWRNIYPVNLRDMAVARSTDGGRTFSAPVRVSEDHWHIDGCPEDGPSLAVTTDNVVHIVWPTLVGDASRQKAVFYSASRDDGQTFAPRTRIDNGTGVAAHPRLVALGAHVTAAWDENTSTGTRVYVRTVAPGRATGTASALGTVHVLGDAPSAVYPAIAASGTDAVVAWTQRTAGGSEIRVARVAP
jgi:hypothetical protein